jgi:2-oxoglutarate ferredoxin oxidoreductase subunit beta
MPTVIDPVRDWKSEAPELLAFDLRPGSLSVESGVAGGDLWIVVHDAHADDPAYAFALSRLSSVETRYAPMGVFRSVERLTYDESMAAQLDDAAYKALICGDDTWTVPA